MSAKARQYEGSLSRMIHAAGARIIGRGADGNSHRTLTFQLHGQTRTFHFASTGASYGHGFRNTQQRLKWLLAEIVPPADELVLPTVQTEHPVPATKPTRVGQLPELAPIQVRRLNKEKRRDIAYFYTSVPSRTIPEVCGKFDLTEERVIHVLMSAAGDSKSKCHRELTIRRMMSARKARERQAEAPRRTLRQLDFDARKTLGREAARLFFKGGLTAAQTAEQLNITASAAYTLAREYA